MVQAPEAPAHDTRTIDASARLRMRSRTSPRECLALQAVAVPTRMLSRPLTAALDHISAAGREGVGTGGGCSSAPSFLPTIALGRMNTKRRTAAVVPAFTQTSLLKVKW